MIYNDLMILFLRVHYVDDVPLGVITASEITRLLRLTPSTFSSCSSGTCSAYNIVIARLLLYNTEQLNEVVERREKS